MKPGFDYHLVPSQWNATNSRHNRNFLVNQMVQKSDLLSMKDIDAKFRIKNIVRELAESDALMIRALEDLMMVLLKKKIIGVEEIHPVVVEKIKNRRKLRDEMKSLRDRLGDKTKDDSDPAPV